MSLLDILFPVTCLECGKSGGYICKNCLTKVEVICRFNPITKTFSIFRYEGVIRRAIIALKYKFAFDIAKELSNVCVQMLKTHSTFYILPATSVLIPIPLHKSRENWRGFNQSEVVGKLIAEDLGWQFEPDLLMRTVASKPQVGLPRSERVRNIRGKFAVNLPAKAGSSLRAGTSPSFIIFDDVLTTGSTLKEAMKVLEKSVAANVTGLTIAK